MVKEKIMIGVMAAMLAWPGNCTVTTGENTEYSIAISGEETVQNVTVIDAGIIPVWSSSASLTWKLYSDGNLIISGDDGTEIKEFAFGFSDDNALKVKKITSDTLMYYPYNTISFSGMKNLEEIDLPILSNEKNNGAAETALYYDSAKLKKINMPKMKITIKYNDRNNGILLGPSTRLEYICFSNLGSADGYSCEYLDSMLDKGYCWFDSDGTELKPFAYISSDGDKQYLYYGSYPITVHKKSYCIYYDINTYTYNENGEYYYSNGKISRYDQENEESYRGGVRVDENDGHRNCDTYIIGSKLTLEPMAIQGYTLFNTENNVIGEEDYGDRIVKFEYISNDALQRINKTETEETGIIDPAAGQCYKLSYNSNGGYVSKTSKILKEDSEYGKLPAPKRTGYTFLGWYTSKNGGTKVSSMTKMNDNNTTIYAHWKKISLKQEQIKSADRTPNKLSITIKYTKDYNADGYIIQYSTSPSFGKSITKYIDGNSTTTYKISKLNRNKTYYMRVCAYRCDSAGKKVRGKWSSRKIMR